MPNNLGNVVRVCSHVGFGRKISLDSIFNCNQCPIDLNRKSTVDNAEFPKVALKSELWKGEEQL